MGRRRPRGLGEPDLDRLTQEEGSSAFRMIDGDAGAGILILCDHAENAIPTAFDRLGLEEQDLHRHIAYDLGAAAVAERVAERLGAPAIVTAFPPIRCKLSKRQIVGASVALTPCAHPATARPPSKISRRLFWRMRLPLIPLMSGRWMRRVLRRRIWQRRVPRRAFARILAWPQFKDF